jgi:hypothetical protein
MQIRRKIPRVLMVLKSFMTALMMRMRLDSKVWGVLAKDRRKRRSQQDRTMDLNSSSSNRIILIIQEINQVSKPNNQATLSNSCLMGSSLQLR